MHVNKTNFHMKGFALGLALKQRRNATRKSPIDSFDGNGYSKSMYFPWKIKWQLEHLGTLRIMVEVAPFF